MGGCKCLFIVFAAVGLVLVAVGGIVGFLILEDYITEQIKQQVMLEEGTEQYERWEELPFALTFKVYFFNITNPDEILNGETPKVQEIGPYVYSQSRKKYDIERNETEDTLFYYQNQLFTFDAAASSPLTEDDVLTVLFAPMNGVLHAVESFLPLVPDLLNGLPSAFPDNNIFSEITVKDYLFNGYTFCATESQLCEIVAAVTGEVKTMQTLSDGSVSFAFLRYKNNTHDGSYKINAGIDVVENLGLITEWEGSSVLPEGIWGTNNTCSEVRGRDSTIYPPYITTEDTFDIFSTDICRVVTLEYVSNEEYMDIDGQRRQLKRDTLANTEENECYCVPYGMGGTTPLESTDTCFPDGFMDLYTCMGAKVILSFPHFLWGDDYYKSTVDGLNPIEEDHVTFVVTEPNTGTPLRGAKRVQFNMILKPIGDLSFLLNVKPAVIPLIWVEEGVELPEHLVDELKSKYFNKVLLVSILRWTLIGVGIFLFVACTACFFWKRR